MKDFVLLIVVLVAFIYGYFLMEKLDKPARRWLIVLIVFLVVFLVTDLI